MNARVMNARVNGPVNGPVSAPVSAPVSDVVTREPVRLTTRGRLVLFVVLLVVAFTALLVWVPTGVATSSAGEPAAVRTVVVQPGETLWDIASRVRLGANTGEAVHEIAELNSLPDTGELQIGQTIAVPVR